MKRGLRITIVIAFTAAMVALLAILDSVSGRLHHEKTCTGLEVSILDSAQRSFVTPEDIKGIIDKGYGVYVGQRLDSVNLRKVEELLNGKSAVLLSQAWLTDDGILHVDITQREPLIMFKTPSGGYYADETGYIFPLMEGYSKEITTVDGDIPMDIPQGYKGEPAGEKEKAWLEGMIRMMEYLHGNSSWGDAVSRISADSRGDLVLYPRKGKEKFIFGRPDDFESKFARMEDYYRYIVPSKEEGWYSTVNVKYDGQIICKK